MDQSTTEARSKAGVDLLEREGELQQLSEALNRASRGDGHTVLISGEAGVGKTTLVERFVGSLPRAFRLLKGACDPLSTPTPLGPLFDIAQTVGGSLERRLRSTAPRPTIFNSLLDVMTTAIDPSILFIEDIHWADVATLDLIRFLVRRTVDLRALLIFTFRDDEISAGHPMRPLLGSFAGQKNIIRIKPAPLSIQAVATLLGTRRRNAMEVHQKTGGNPFYVTEVIGHGDDGLPSTIRDAVLARASGLSARARHLVELVAVIGTRADQDFLERFAWVTPRLAAEAIGTGTLTETAAGLGFRHELARVAILDSMGPLQRRKLFREVLELAADATTSVAFTPAQLVHYAVGAGNGEAIVRYGLAAAKAAAALGAHREAATHYRQASALAHGKSTSEQAGYLEALARECAIFDNLAEAIDSYRAAIELRIAAKDELRAGADWAAMAWPLVRSGRNAEAEHASLQAISVLERLPPSKELANAYRVQAHLRMLDRERAAAVRWGRKAIALATTLGDIETIAGAELVVGAAMLVSGDDKGRAPLMRCLMLARKKSFDDLAALVYVNSGSSYGELYRFAEADRELSEGLAFTRDRDLDHSQHYMQAWLAITRLYQGRWPEAADLAATVLAEPNCASVTRIMALTALGRVRARRGDPGAHRLLDEALVLASQTGTLQRLAPVHAARAEVAWLAGDAGAAIVEARAVFDLALRLRHRWHTAEFGYWRFVTGDAITLPRWAARPFTLQIEGRWKQAAELWQELDCPYERARALADGDIDAQMEALRIFTELGADPAIKIVARKIREAGVRHIPRGPRASTRANPVGLTKRQLDVLSCVCENLSNKQIASRLNLSPKTVDHHISAVLAKLGAATRQDAAKRAKEQQIVSAT